MTVKENLRLVGDRRIAELAARVTWVHLRDEPERVAIDLRRALTRRSVP